MSIVKINNIEFDVLKENLDKSLEQMTNVKESWSENFTNLYYAFVENGFLESLYEKSKENFYKVIENPLLKNNFNQNNMTNNLSNTWDENAKKEFINKLNDCCRGKVSTYKEISTIGNKIANIKNSLNLVLEKVLEFESIYSSLKETANSSNSKIGLKIAKDGKTILGFESTITIDGKEIKVSTSEAMNAFYTYTNTVMDSEISSDYLVKEYGYDIDFNSIIKNANGFMTETIESDLYTPDFVDYLLPEFIPNNGNILPTGALNIKLDNIQSSLNKNKEILGNVALFGGLIGASFIGKASSPAKKASKSKKIFPKKKFPKIEPTEIKDYSKYMFFSKYKDPNTLALKRQKDVADFESLYNKNPKLLYEKFINMGYTNEEAKKITDDKSLGISAYLLDIQRNEIAHIENDITKENQYENLPTKQKPKFTDLIDGTATIELSSPYENEEINKSLNNIKEYESKLQNTNEKIESIENKAKQRNTNINHLTRELIKKYGKEKSNWDEIELANYNTELANYNKDINVLKEYQSKKESLNTNLKKAKSNLKEAENNYYKELRKEIDDACDDSTSTDDTSNDEELINELFKYTN